MKALKRKSIRIVAFAMAVIFSFETIIPSQEAQAIQQYFYTGVATSEAPVGVSSKIGRVEMAFPPGKSTPVFFYHIQDAHASAEAQGNIAQILTRLYERKQLDLVLVEGAAGSLMPERLDVFEAPQKNSAYKKDLFNAGLLNGAAYFIAGQKGVSSYGLEEPSVYFDHLQIFRRVVAARPGAEKFLNTVEVLMMSTFKNILQMDVFVFLKEWKMQHQRELSWDRYLPFLARSAEKFLGLDLHDYHAQVLWPNLVRFCRVDMLQDQIHPQAVQKEFREVSKALERERDPALRQAMTLLSASIESQTAMIRETPDFRKYVEILVEACRREGVFLQQYPNLVRYLALRIFRSEIEPEGLLAEVERLEDTIFDKLFSKGKMRGIISAYRDFFLLKRAFGLDLDRSESKRFLALDIEKKVRQFSKISQGYDLQEENVIQGANLVKQFYMAAQKRDGVFMEQVRNSLHKAQVFPDRPFFIALVTGGYHAEGIENWFRAEGLPFASIQPSFKDEPKTDRYENLLMGDYRTTDALAPAQGSIETDAMAENLMGRGAFLALRSAEANLTAKHGVVYLQNTGSSKTVRSENRSTFKEKARWLHDLVGQFGVRKSVGTGASPPAQIKRSERVFRDSGKSLRMSVGRNAMKFLLRVALAGILSGCATHKEFLGKTAAWTPVERPALFQGREIRLSEDELQKLVIENDYGVELSRLQFLSKKAEEGLLKGTWDLDLEFGSLGLSHTQPGLGTASVKASGLGAQLAATTQLSYRIFSKLLGQDVLARELAFRYTQKQFYLWQDQVLQRFLVAKGLWLNIAKLGEQKSALENTEHYFSEKILPAAEKRAGLGTMKEEDVDKLRDKLVELQGRIEKVNAELTTENTKLVGMISGSSQDMGKQVVPVLDAQQRRGGAGISDDPEKSVRRAMEKQEAGVPRNRKLAANFVGREEVAIAGRLESFDQWSRLNIETMVKAMVSSAHLDTSEVEVITALKNPFAPEAAYDRTKKQPAVVAEALPLWGAAEAKKNIATRAVLLAEEEVRKKGMELQARFRTLHDELKSARKEQSLLEVTLQKTETYLEQFRRTNAQGQRYFASDVDLAPAVERSMNQKIRILELRYKILILEEEIKTLGGGENFFWQDRQAPGGRAEIRSQKSDDSKRAEGFSQIPTARSKAWERRLSSSVLAMTGTAGLVLGTVGLAFILVPHLEKASWQSFFLSLGVNVSWAGLIAMYCVWMQDHLYRGLKAFISNDYWKDGWDFAKPAGRWAVFFSAYYALIGQIDLSGWMNMNEWFEIILKTGVDGLLNYFIFYPLMLWGFFTGVYKESRNESLGEFRTRPYFNESRRRLFAWFFAVEAGAMAVNKLWNPYLSELVILSGDIAFTWVSLRMIEKIQGLALEKPEPASRVVPDVPRASEIGLRSEVRNIHMASVVKKPVFLGWKPFFISMLLFFSLVAGASDMLPASGSDTRTEFKSENPGAKLGDAYGKYDEFVGRILSTISDGGGKEDLKRFAQILRVTTVSAETLRDAQLLFVREVMHAQDAGKLGSKVVGVPANVVAPRQEVPPEPLAAAPSPASAPESFQTQANPVLEAKEVAAEKPAEMTPTLKALTGDVQELETRNAELEKTVAELKSRLEKIASKVAMAGAVAVSETVRPKEVLVPTVEEILKLKHVAKAEKPDEMTPAWKALAERVRSLEFRYAELEKTLEELKSRIEEVASKVAIAGAVAASETVRSKEALVPTVEEALKLKQVAKAEKESFVAEKVSVEQEIPSAKANEEVVASPKSEQSVAEESGQDRLASVVVPPVVSQTFKIQSVFDRDFSASPLPLGETGAIGMKAKAPFEGKVEPFGQPGQRVFKAGEPVHRVVNLERLGKLDALRKQEEVLRETKKVYEEDGTTTIAEMVKIGHELIRVKTERISLEQELEAGTYRSLSDIQVVRRQGGDVRAGDSVTEFIPLNRVRVQIRVPVHLMNLNHFRVVINDQPAKIIEMRLGEIDPIALEVPLILNLQLAGVLEYPDRPVKVHFSAQDFVPIHGQEPLYSGPAEGPAVHTVARVRAREEIPVPAPRMPGRISFRAFDGERVALGETIGAVTGAGGASDLEKDMGVFDVQAEDFLKAAHEAETSGVPLALREKTDGLQMQIAEGGKVRALRRQFEVQAPQEGILAGVSEVDGMGVAGGLSGARILTHRVFLGDDTGRSLSSMILIPEDLKIHTGHEVIIRFDDGADLKGQVTAVRRGLTHSDADLRGFLAVEIEVMDPDYRLHPEMPVHVIIPERVSPRLQGHTNQCSGRPFTYVTHSEISPLPLIVEEALLKNPGQNPQANVVLDHLIPSILEDSNPWNRVKAFRYFSERFRTPMFYEHLYRFSLEGPKDVAIAAMDVLKQERSWIPLLQVLDTVMRRAGDGRPMFAAETAYDYLLDLLEDNGEGSGELFRLIDEEGSLEPGLRDRFQSFFLSVMKHQEPNSVSVLRILRGPFWTDSNLAELYGELKGQEGALASLVQDELMRRLRFQKSKGSSYGYYVNQLVSLKQPFPPLRRKLYRLENDRVNDTGFLGGSPGWKNGIHTALSEPLLEPEVERLAAEDFDSLVSRSHRNFLKQGQYDLSAFKRNGGRLGDFAQRSLQDQQSTVDRLFVRGDYPELLRILHTQEHRGQFSSAIVSRMLTNPQGRFYLASLYGSTEDQPLRHILEESQSQGRGFRSLLFADADAFAKGDILKEHYAQSSEAAVRDAYGRSLLRFYAIEKDLNVKAMILCKLLVLTRHDREPYFFLHPAGNPSSWVNRIRHALQVDERDEDAALLRNAAQFEIERRAIRSAIAMEEERYGFTDVGRRVPGYEGTILESLRLQTDSERVGRFLECITRGESLIGKLETNFPEGTGFKEREILKSVLRIARDNAEQIRHNKRDEIGPVWIFLNPWYGVAAVVAIFLVLFFAARLGKHFIWNKIQLLADLWNYKPGLKRQRKALSFIKGEHEEYKIQQQYGKNNPAAASFDHMIALLDENSSWFSADQINTVIRYAREIMAHPDFVYSRTTLQDAKTRDFYESTHTYWTLSRLLLMFAERLYLQIRAGGLSHDETARLRGQHKALLDAVAASTGLRIMIVQLENMKKAESFRAARVPHPKEKSTAEMGPYRSYRFQSALWWYVRKLILYDYFSRQSRKIYLQLLEEDVLGAANRFFVYAQQNGPEPSLHGMEDEGRPFFVRQLLEDAKRQLPSVFYPSRTVADTDGIEVENAERQLFGRFTLAVSVTVHVLLLLAIVAGWFAGLSLIGTGLILMITGAITFAGYFYHILSFMKSTHASFDVMRRNRAFWMLRELEEDEAGRLRAANRPVTIAPETPSERSESTGKSRSEVRLNPGVIVFDDVLGRNIHAEVRRVPSAVVFQDVPGRSIQTPKAQGYREGLRAHEAAGFVAEKGQLILQKRPTNPGTNLSRQDILFAERRASADTSIHETAKRKMREKLFSERRKAPFSSEFRLISPWFSHESPHRKQGDDRPMIRRKESTVFLARAGAGLWWDDFQPGDDAGAVVPLSFEEAAKLVGAQPERFSPEVVALIATFGPPFFSPRIVSSQTDEEIRIVTAIVIAGKILAVRDAGLLSRLEASLEDCDAVSDRIAPALATLAGAHDISAEALKTRLESLLRQEQIQTFADDRLVFLDAGTVSEEYFKKLMNSPVPVVVLFDRRHKVLYDQVSKEQLRRNQKSSVLLVYAPDGVSTFVKRALQSGDAFLSASPRLNAVLTRFRNHGKVDDIALITRGRAESQKVEADYVGHRYYYGDETLRLDPELIFYSLQLLLRSPELFRYGKGRNAQDVVSLIGLVLQQLAQELQASLKTNTAV